MSCKDEKKKKTRNDTLLTFDKYYFYLKRRKNNCFINKNLAYIQTEVWPVHWIAGFQVFDVRYGFLTGSILVGF